jgi:hypothetical protein
MGRPRWRGQYNTKTKKWLTVIEEVAYKKIARYTKATAETDVTVYLRQPILMAIRAKV